MRFDEWRAEAARIAGGYSIDLDRVPKPYLWRLSRRERNVRFTSNSVRTVHGSEPSRCANMYGPAVRSKTEIQDRRT
jgi:hypothetical protein